MAQNLPICRSEEDAHKHIPFLLMYLVCHIQNAVFILVHLGDVYVCIVIVLYLYVVYCPWSMSILMFCQYEFHILMFLGRGTF